MHCRTQIAKAALAHLLPRVIRQREIGANRRRIFKKLQNCGAKLQQFQSVKADRTESREKIEPSGEYAAPGLGSHGQIEMGGANLVR